MNKRQWLYASTCAAILSACVTINVYFPAAAAQQAADRFIDEVWDEDGAAPAVPTPDGQSSLAPVWVTVLDFIVPPARAQQADVDISSPAIRRLASTMEARFAQLLPYYNAGNIGLTADGDVAIRDLSSVPLAQRSTLKSLVQNENADRAALYREIAQANGQPQWESDIREVFARRWIAKARAGWYYQNASGAWLRKG